MPRFASGHSSKTIIDLENRVRNVSGTKLALAIFTQMILFAMASMAIFLVPG